MNYAAIKKVDIANGEGVRVSLFVSGCNRHCKGCFNQEAWDFNYGKPFTSETENELYEALNHDYISGLSVLGGEPFDMRNIPQVLRLCRWVKHRFPHKTVWVYTGRIWEEIWFKNDLENIVDVVVDGAFIEEKKDPSLVFRGSSNQRIIDVRKSIEQERIVLYA